MQISASAGNGMAQASFDAVAVRGGFFLKFVLAILQVLLYSGHD